MDALYNIKDTNIHGKENKKISYGSEIKTAFYESSKEKYSHDEINKFYSVADNVMNRSKYNLNKNDLEKFKADLIEIKNNISPQSFSKITKSLNKLLEDFDK